MKQGKHLTSKLILLETIRTGYVHHSASQVFRQTDAVQYPCTASQDPVLVLLKPRLTRRQGKTTQ